MHRPHDKRVEGNQFRMQRGIIPSCLHGHDDDLIDDTTAFLAHGKHGHELIGVGFLRGTDEIVDKR